MKTKVHETLKQLREEGGFTQSELSDICGVGISTYKSYEHGKSIPTADTIAMLSVFYGVPTDTIIFGYESLKKELDGMVKDGIAEVPTIDVINQIAEILKTNGHFASIDAKTMEPSGSAIHICNAVIQTIIADWFLDRL